MGDIGKGGGKRKYSLYFVHDPVTPSKWSHAVMHGLKHKILQLIDVEFLYPTFFCFPWVEPNLNGLHNH